MLRMVVRSQTCGIFRRAVGSSPRIGVCPVVIGWPTVRLADLVGTERDGAGSVGLTAATALTVRLCGWAAAPGRPPPAVWPRHRAIRRTPKSKLCTSLVQVNWVLPGTEMPARVLPSRVMYVVESAHAAPAGLEWRRSRKHTCHRALLLVSPLHAAGAQGFCDPWANSHEAGIPTASLQFAHDGCMCRSVQC